MAILVAVPVLLLSLTLALWPALGGARVYQWTDADGAVQFSDRPPDPSPARTTQAAGDASKKPAAGHGLKVQVVPVDFRPNDVIDEGVVETIPRAIYDIVQVHLGLGLPVQSTLTVRLFADQAAYDRFVGPEAARANPDGRFVPEAQELVTWYRPSADLMAQALGGLTSDALLHGRFAFAPPWLREGLAHYFQLLRVVGDSTAVLPDPRREQALQALSSAGRLLPTARLLALTADEWRAENKKDQRAQNQSGSLVYFLLSTPDGGRLVGEILKRSQTAVGDAAVSAAVIDSSLAGGVDGLDRRWREWLSSQKAAPGD